MELPILRLSKTPQSPKQNNYSLQKLTIENGSPYQRDQDQDWQSYDFYNSLEQNQPDSTDPFARISSSYIKGKIRDSKIITPPTAHTESEIKKIQSIFEKLSQKRGISFLWMFIIKKRNPQVISGLKDLKQKLFGLENQNQAQDQFSQLLPVCKNFKEAEHFFKARNCVFHVVTDLQSAAQLLKRPQLQEKILSVYLYNDSDNLRETTKAIRIKEQLKKCRGYVEDLNPLLERAYIDMENGINFTSLNGSSEAPSFVPSNLPTFIKLNQSDKSQITAYRISLYGKLNLTDKEQRLEKLKIFENLVRRVYAKNSWEIQNLELYLTTIVHTLEDNKDLNIGRKHWKVLNFYCKETFYYKVTNNLLRICRTGDEFQPAVIPFNQNYHAIKYFYNKSCQIKQEAKQSLESPTSSFQSLQLYRGATIRQMEFYNLKIGDFVELLGFVSASKDKAIAKKFSKGYMFVITIKARTVPFEYRDYDHGYVDLNQHSIPDYDRQKEQEVLLNAFNVYKVTQIVKPNEAQDGIGRVYLQYGAIFELMEKDKETLSHEEINVLKNYKFCVKQMKEIKDVGGSLIKQGKPQEAKAYYEKKLQKQLSIQDKIHCFNNLTESNLILGKLEDARLSAIESFTLYENQLKNSSTVITPQKREQIFQVYEKHISLLLEKEDSVYAKKCVNSEIDLIDEETEWLLKTQKLVKRAQINLKQENIIQSQKDLKKSEEILLKKKNSFQQKRQNIQKQYSFTKIFSFLCMDQAVEGEKLIKLRQIEQNEQEFEKSKKKVYELLLRINEGQIKISKIVGDKKLMEELVSKGKEYFEEIKKNVIEEKQEDKKDPFEVAKFMVLEAKIENAIEQTKHVEKSYQLLDDAIKLIENKDKHHEKVGQYCKIKANYKKNELKNILSMRNDKDLSNQPSNQSKSESPAQTLNSKEYEQIFDETIQIYEKTLAIAIYHKTEDHPIVFEIKNQMGEVWYDNKQYEECKEQVAPILQTKRGPNHSEGAKSALLIAKIHLSQGEIYEAQIFVQRSYVILRAAFVNEKQTKWQTQSIYEDIMKLSPIFRETKLFECKLLNKQGEHEQALKKVEELKEISRKKLENADRVGYLAEIYEEMGITHYFMGDMKDFLKYSQKAIELRIHEMGKYNIPNAICLCTMAKYSIFQKNLSRASIYLNKSFEIFSRFPVDHPLFWIQHSTMAYYSEMEKDTKNQLRRIQESIKLIDGKYSKNHISLIKMKVRYADALAKNNDDEKAIKLYEKLTEELEEDECLSRIYQSQIRDTSRMSRINEKVLIKEEVEKALCSTQMKMSRIQNLSSAFESPQKFRSSPQLNSPVSHLRFSRTMSIGGQSNSSQASPGESPQRNRERYSNWQIEGVN